MEIFCFALSSTSVVVSEIGVEKHFIYPWKVKVGVSVLDAKKIKNDTEMQ